MMGLTFACIAPHGFEIIPELTGDACDSFSETRKGMEKLASLMNRQEADTIIIATPHNMRLEATIGVVTTEYTEGKLGENDRQVRLRFKCDRKLAKIVLENARKHRIPVVGVNFGTSEGQSSCMPMDWGAFIPLWFLARHNNERVKILLITPARDIPIQKLIRLGNIIAETAEASKKRITFVASADQGHAHDLKGPYGFHPASEEFDEKVKEAVMKYNLKPLLHLPSQFIEDAKPDSVWQLAILQGILERIPMEAQLLSYQVPTYYGMLCAAYVPV